MARLNILKEPNPMLRKVSRPVAEWTPRIAELLDDMTETMHAAAGVGLAAPQVGVLYRMAVLDTDEHGVLEVINPTVITASKNRVSLEGCLSVPDRNGRVKRPHLLTIEYYDRNGRKQTAVLSNRDAVIACHEIDHLNGILFIDKLVK